MQIVKNIIKILFTFLVILICFSCKWAITNYGNISFDEILFYLFSPLNGTADEFINSYILNSLIPSIFITILLLIFIRMLVKSLLRYNISLKIKLFSHKKSFFISDKMKKIIIYIPLLIIYVTILYINLSSIGFFEYAKNQIMKSTFIEENYVDSKKVALTFPKDKRNLIYIYVESLESTYFSKDLGGGLDENYMTALTDLTNENIQFSNTDKFGGALQAFGTSWTSSAMVAQTSGVPVKIKSTITNSENLSSYMKGVYSLGEILNKEGYNQMILFGSNKAFGNRGLYFKTHGNYQIYDYYKAIKNKKIPNDYFVWWGFEDTKLFEIAKEEIIKLSDEDKPFNFTMLTSDTHHPNGYLEKSCLKKYNDKFSNVIACTSEQLKEFVDWLKEQDFYDNTTIIIVGDHLSMNATYFDRLDKDYDRTVYNLFINSKVFTKNTKNRQFSTMDMFPTTLASMGVKIEGDRLGLGTNLFSDKETLIEKYGIDKVNKELSLNSKFYKENILKENKE